MLLWNLIALAAFAAGLGYLGLTAALGAPLRVTALDRAGVLDEAKLREAYPSLVANMRRDLGMWVAERERQAAFSAGWFGIGASVVNIFLVLLLRQTKQHASEVKTDSR